MRVVITGGRGLLGSRLSPMLAERGHDVIVTSRSATGDGAVAADLLTGEGLGEAMSGADVIIHLASDAQKPKKVDVAGTERLLSVLDPGQRIVYMSIVGVDRHPFFYYRSKLQVEQMIESSGIPFTILRATQFHEFVAFFLGAAVRSVAAIVPKKFVFQPVDTGEVASHLADLMEEGRTGLVPDFAGPEIHTAEYLARTLMEQQGRERPMIPLPVFGRAASAFKQGIHTNPERAVGNRTWEQFLSERA